MVTIGELKSKLKWADGKIVKTVTDDLVIIIVIIIMIIINIRLY